ncbi:MAG: glycerate 2-kinase [Verrucomicrobiota bacterium]|jgi:glycerate kinase
MRILIAPDKFKGSLNAREVADSIAAGLRDAVPEATIEIIAVADGGEGTADVISQACAGEWVNCDAHDALGRGITARYFRLREKTIAVMEMSEAAGGWRLAPHERDPLHANTFGVGEMLKDAASRGATEILIGLGGSATNDGGFGLARALGFRFFAEDTELVGGSDELQNLTKIIRPDVEALVPSAFSSGGRLAQAPLHLIAAVDVRNPLLGERGATRTFGPQKGATPEQLEILERALARLADVVARDLGCDFREAPGAGAAGGLGFGLMSFCGAEVRPGFEVVAEFIDLESAIQRADVVITGEGSLDRQTLEGKAPAGVARLARKNGKRVFAIAGAATADQTVLEVFDGVLTLASPSITREEAMTRSRELLRERAQELAKAL